MNPYKFINEKKEHLHTLRGLPLFGNTTALGVLAKNLVWWAAELSAVECLESGEKIPTIRQEYLDAKEKGKEGIDALQRKYPAFKKARFAHYDSKNEKAETGSGMHESLEKYVKLMISDQAGKPMLMNDYEHPAVEIFAKWALKNVKQFLASEGNGYNEKLWLGGILDLLYEDMDGKLVILDFKSAKEAYMSHFIQCAMCDLEISESGVLDNDGNVILDLKGRKIDYYGVFPFGMKNPEPQFYFDTFKAKEAVAWVVGLHKLINVK